MSLTPLPPSRHQESLPLGHTFTLPAIKGPLPAELKFRENTADIYIRPLVRSLLLWSHVRVSLIQTIVD